MFKWEIPAVDVSVLVEFLRYLSIYVTDFLDCYYFLITYTVEKIQQTNTL